MGGGEGNIYGNGWSAACVEGTTSSSTVNDGDVNVAATTASVRIPSCSEEYKQFLFEWLWNCLAQLYAKDITPDDKQELDEALQREVLRYVWTDLGCLDYLYKTTRVGSIHYDF